MRSTIGRWTGIAAGVMALAVASPALAQEGRARHAPDPEKRIERLTEALDLTDAQAAEIRSIFAEQAEKRQELRTSGDREAMRAHMRETHERMASVLTDAQREKLGTLHERRGEKPRHRDGERRRAPRDGGEG